jgi:GalNAc-alpha-(1->4)-GalNAc-alpha-(1->3)-diNAcBac-PP-undecaprenol alpha-1,4-N-acetyl-D-galactosaminyltransferase
MDMRITTVISALTGGGAARVCVNLANAWVARGNRVSILTVSQTSTAAAYAIDSRVERCNLSQTANSNESDILSTAPIVRGLLQCGCPEMIEQAPLIARLRHAIVITKPDVVVAHIDMTNLRVLAAMHETGIPVVACEHTDATQVSIGAWQKARQVLYRRAHAVVALHSVIAEWLRLRGASAFTIPNPLYPPSQGTSRPKDDRHRLITLTRLSPEKRIDLLIRAFAEIAANFPEWDLDIYGDGHLHAELPRLIDKLAPGRVYLRGFTKDPYAALRGADLFALTSWVEGFPCAVWEALACGIPVVAMDCGAPIRSLVRNGVDGLIVRTTAALVEALSSLMSDEGLRNALAARAGEVVTRFPAEDSLKAWDALLNDVTLASSVSARESPESI